MFVVNSHFLVYKNQTICPQTKEVAGYVRFIVATTMVKNLAAAVVIAQGVTIRGGLPEASGGVAE